MDAVLKELSVAVGQRLRARKWVLTTAESCTGGWVAQVVTATPGSSEWFDRGYVSYSNAAKQEMLGVRSTTLRTFGAVSEQTAGEMVLGALRRSHAQVALAITGVAGPSGGTPDKPVGTVCFAWCRQGGEAITATRRFAGDREAVRHQSVVVALSRLMELLPGAADDGPSLGRRKD